MKCFLHRVTEHESAMCAVTHVIYERNTEIRKSRTSEVTVVS